MSWSDMPFHVSRDGRTRVAIRFVLPDGELYAVYGPRLAPEELGPVAVTYHPLWGVKVFILHNEASCGRIYVKHCTPRQLAQYRVRSETQLSSAAAQLRLEVCPLSVVQ